MVVHLRFSVVREYSWDGVDVVDVHAPYLLRLLPLSRRGMWGHVFRRALRLVRARDKDGREGENGGKETPWMEDVANRVWITRRRLVYADSSGPRGV